MNIKDNFLNYFHSLLAKSKIASHIAVKIRNQCDLIIRQRFGAKDFDPEKNGEHLLLKTILNSCQVYFDVGANKGDWTDFIIQNKKTSYKCYLFEPGLNAFAQLTKRFANNDEINLNNKALNDTPGALEFFEEENAGEMSSAIKGWAKNPTKTITVQCTTIDEEIKLKNISFIDFLKIDVEGFDLKVLEGAVASLTEKKIGIIQFEYNEVWFSTGSTLLSAYTLLRSKNYSIYLIKPEGLITFDVDLYGEYYTFSNFVAVSPGSHTLIEKLIY